VNAASNDEGHPPAPHDAAPTAALPLGDRNRISRRLIDVSAGSLQDRILNATLACLGRWGTVKTTLDDVAREAGCSRATVYRAFPDGRDALFEAAGARELFGVLHELAEAAAEAPELGEQLAALVHLAMTAIRDHEVLQYLCKHEPGVILPFVLFDGIDPILDIGVAVISPHLERFLDARTAARTAEWLARLVISFGFDPQEGDPDLADHDEARRFVDTFILPGLGGNRPDPNEPKEPR
jgi:AcrR family transcriptional regulator